MTTDFLDKLLPPDLDGRDEIIKKIFAESGKTLNAEKSKHADYEAIKTELETAKGTIAELEKNKGDTAVLNAELEKYKAAEQQRAADAERARERASIESRFETVANGRQFVHSFVRDGVFNEFMTAVKDSANAGKGDKEIFDSLTKDKDYFASQNPRGNMGGFGSVGGDDDGVTAAFLARNPELKGKI